MKRWLVPFAFLLVALQASAVDREIYFTASTPSQPALTWDQQRRLNVGRLTLSLTDNEAAVLDMTGGWAQGRFVAVWKTDSQGRYLNAQNMITTDPNQFVLVKYLVDWLGISLRNADLSWTSVILIAPDSQARNQPVAYTAGAGIKVGEYYWYNGDTVNIVDITNGTPFRTPADAQQFKRPDLFLPSYGLYRAQTNRYATGNDAIDFGIEKIPSRSLNAGQYDGGHMGVVTTDKNGYVFFGANCLVDGLANPDPYLLDGSQQAIPNASVNADGSISWTVSIFGNERKIYSAAVNLNRGGSQLTEPVYSQWMAYQQSTADIITVTNIPVNRTTVGGQDVTELGNTVVTSREGGVDGQTSMAEIQAALASGEYLKFDNGKVMATEGASYADAGLESLRMGIATGMTDTISMESQGQKNLLEQVSPVAQEPVAQDALALVTAINTVETEMYQQTPTSLPLQRIYPRRYAEMLPAGWLPSYLQGNSTPGDGTNPVSPFPPGVTTGAPCYDLDGDGSLDRFGTSDPYRNGHDQIILKWNVGARQFRLGDYPNCMTQCAFAVYGQNHAKPEDRQLLFAGYDGVIWVERRDKWRGINYYSFALSSLLEPTGAANEFHFGLAYQGKTPVSVKPTPPAPPTTNTVTWTNTTPVTMANGEVMSVITETGVETVYLWSDLGDPAVLVTGAFSDPTFIPRATNGRPACCAKYVRTRTPFIVSGTGSAPGATVTTTVFFSAEFRDDQIVQDAEPVVGSYDNSFMWSYPRPDGMPFNYARGKNFASGQIGVTLNTNDVLARFGGQFPLQSVNSLVESNGVDFRVKWTPDGVTPVAADNILAYMSGERLFDIIDGAGYYLFKGKWVPCSSGKAQRDLLRQMWEWDMYQPKTVFTVLNCDNDPAKPLLNTARAPIASTARDLYDPNTGVLNLDLRQGTGANMNVNASRRSELLNTYWMVFSAAKGREHEIDMALRSPKGTKLKCVEWDDFNDVQTKFAGYDIEFYFNNEVERKFVGEIITKIYGRTNLEGRTTAGGAPSTTVTGESGVADMAMANPGSYIFTENDLLYGKPCNFLKLSALLDDLQYGDPKPEQWVTNLKMQIRHPMVIYYDDRWSAVVAAYGTNADPRHWCAEWDKYSKPNSGEGTDLCKVEFENNCKQKTLADLYDRMHAEQYQEAKKGDITLPTRPTLVNQPIQPVKPAEWTGGAIDYPALIADPGLRPAQPFYPVWTATRSSWLANAATGGRAGAGLFDVSSYANWTNTYSMSVALQSAHDQWITQFGTKLKNVVISPMQTQGGTSINLLADVKTGTYAWPTVKDTSNRVWTINPIAYGNNIGSTSGTSAATCGALTGTCSWRTTYNNGRPPAGNSCTLTGTITGINAKKCYKAAADGSFAYLVGTGLHYLATGLRGADTYPELQADFPFTWASSPGWNVFPVGSQCRIEFDLDYPTNVTLVVLAYDDQVNVYIDSGYITTVAGDWSWIDSFDHQWTRLLSAGHHIFTAGSPAGANSIGDVRGMMVRCPLGNSAGAIAMADSDLATWNNYQNLDALWVQNRARYDSYLQLKAAADQKKAAYDAWLSDYQIKIGKYYQDLATYQAALTAYNQYVIDDAAWVVMYNTYSPLITMWQSYIHTRDSWVYLVMNRAAESGVSWTNDEPIGQGYMFWKTQPECTCQ